MLLWNHQITMETGAYLCPTIWTPTCAPTSAAIMFNNNRFGGSGERDDHHQRHQEPAYSTTWSTIVTGAPRLRISWEPVTSAHNYDANYVMIFMQNHWMFPSWTTTLR